MSKEGTHNYFDRFCLKLSLGNECNDRTKDGNPTHCEDHGTHRPVLSTSCSFFLVLGNVQEKNIANGFAPPSLFIFFCCG
jgi:hypothetical protein